MLIQRKAINLYLLAENLRNCSVNVKFLKKADAANYNNIFLLNLLSRSGCAGVPGSSPPVSCQVPFVSTSVTSSGSGSSAKHPDCDMTDNVGDKR